MQNADTSLGGAQRSFPETVWSLIGRLGSPSTIVQRQGFEDLCRAYWKPVYTYIRLARSKTNDEAKDLTQAFFLWLTEGNALHKYAPERASFRTYLKLLLRHFLSHEEEARRRLKREGSASFVELNETLPDPEGSDPERAFEREWLRVLLDRSIDRVRNRMIASGRESAFQMFEAYDLAGSEHPTYAELAARFGVKESDVRNRLFAVREEIRSEIRSALADSTADAAQLEEEWNVFFGS